jgi:hypothetical protein
MEASSSDSVTPEKLYEIQQANIKETDQISFKLLGLVPLVNGVALLAAVLGSSTISRPSAPAIVALSLFGAFVTLGLFWWELRNIQSCLRYIEIAEILEAGVLARARVPDRLRRRPPAPGGLGKRRGEKLIYSAVVVSWLVLPITLLERKALPDFGWVLYGILVLGGVYGTIRSILARVDTPPKQRTEPYNDNVLV